MNERYISKIAALAFATLVASPAIAFAAPVPTGALGNAPVYFASEIAVPLTPPVGKKLSLVTRGIGVQIYECKPAKNDSKHFEWVFKAPDAELFDRAGKRIGKHYAGPTWEANDDSKVVGEIKGRNDSPDPNAIPWLLLSAKSNAGNGVFSRVQFIQRLHTVGGKAPATGCVLDQVGTEMRVNYEAWYYFYTGEP